MTINYLALLKIRKYYWSPNASKLILLARKYKVGVIFISL